MAALELLNPFDLNEFPEVIDECLEDGFISCCAFNAKGTVLAAGCSDGRLVIFDFLTKSPTIQFWGHLNSIKNISWSFCGRYIFTVSLDTSCIVWDLRKMERSRTIFCEAPAVYGTFHPAKSDKILISMLHGMPPIEVSLGDSQESLSRKQIFAAEQSESTKIQSFYIATYDKTGDRIITGSPTGEIMVFNADDPRKITLKHNLCNSQIIQLIVSKDNKYIISNSKDRALRLLAIEDQFESLRMIHKFQDLVNKVQWTCVSFSPDFEYIIAGSNRDHSLYTWDVAAGTLFKILEGPRDPSLDLSWHPTRPVIASVSSYGFINLWSKTSPENWSAFAPGFKELETNIEYLEREDEFDKVPESEITERKRIIEDAAVNVLPLEEEIIYEDVSIRINDK